MIRVLVVCSYKQGYKDHVASFISEQVESLRSYDIEPDFFLLRDKGVRGYLRNRKKLLEKIKDFHPHLIHAHYGLSGLLAALQRRVPVVTTYHGTDINNDKVFRFSKIAIRLSAFNIFVSDKNLQKAGQSKHCAVIPCGVDVKLFKPEDKGEARKKAGISAGEKVILFAGAFDNKVKNPDLAREAIAVLPGVRLIELKGYSREEVALLMNAVDAVLMTSFTEGSPQFIKEAMACNCPVVSVDVGDVKELLGNTAGCYITEQNVEAVKNALEKAIAFKGRTTGRQRIEDKGLALDSVAKKLSGIYRQIIKN